LIFFIHFGLGTRKDVLILRLSKNEEENLVAILSLPEGKISSIGKPTTNSRP
jgi:hypothetical protein